MSFQEFRREYQNEPFIQASAIWQRFPDFDRNALTRWQKKGYLLKLRNGLYRLQESPVQQREELFLLANRIYWPSYVSLESALSWYGLIPEGVFTTTSISARTTRSFSNILGNFSYQSLRPDLFFGYRMYSFGAYRFKLAYMEKALLDMLYLDPSLDTIEAISGLRLNPFEFAEIIDEARFYKYVARFNSKQLAQRAELLINYTLEDAVTE